MKNLEAVMNQYAKYVIQQSRTRLTKDDKGGGNLYNSLLECYNGYINLQ